LFLESQKGWRCTLKGEMNEEDKQKYMRGGPFPTREAAAENFFDVEPGTLKGASQC
jgi:hypothetical protein